MTRLSRRLAAIWRWLTTPHPVWDDDMPEDLWPATNPQETP